MKKFLIVCATTALLSSPSYATGFFVGADLLRASAKHQAKNSSTTSGPQNGEEQGANKMGYGVNAGFRFDFLTLLASGELFYDNINTSSKNFKQTSGQSSASDSIAINNRYGVKANVGFSIFPRITPFLTYGLTNISYSSDVLSNNQSITKTELTPIYGIGLLIDLPLGISAKASYDYQQFNASYASSGSKINTHLGVAKLGLIYNF